MSIIISQNSKNAKKIDKSDFEKENYLQNYIHENPESIPVYEIEEDKKLFVVAREFPTESGPIDALAIDKDGDIYVVETKLYKNPDKRTVVAQAMDYGASLWRHSDYNAFMSRINDEINKKFSTSFEEMTKKFFSIEDEEMTTILEAIRTNLQQGNIKFVILMDTIGDRLKDLIVYVNQNSQFDIYAVQMEYYKFEDYEIMIPKLFGVEVKKNVGIKLINNRKIWTEEDFINQTHRELKNNANKIINLYEYFKKNADEINWGTGNINGSFAPVLYKFSKTTSPFSFYSNGKIQIKFSWLKDHDVDVKKLEKCYNTFSNFLKKNTNINVPSGYLENFSISQQEFLKNYDNLVKIIKNIYQK